MWRVLAGIIFIFGVAFGQPPAAEADSSAYVTVTAYGFICGGPGGFTVTYVSDYEVRLTWTMGEDAARTVVRGGVNYEPLGMDDGFPVYNGTGMSATAMVNLDGGDVYFFKAWHQSADGVWNDEDTATAQAEGIGMVLIALVLLAVGLTAIGFWQKRIVMMLAAGLAWFAMGMYGLVVRAATASDVLFAVGWLGIVLALVCFMATAWLREKPEPLETPLSAEDAYMEETNAMLEKHRERRRRLREHRG